MLLQKRPTNRYLTLHLRQTPQLQTDRGTLTGMKVSIWLDGHQLYFGILSLGDGTNRLLRNVTNKLQLLAM